MHKILTKCNNFIQQINYNICEMIAIVKRFGSGSLPVTCKDFFFLNNEFDAYLQSG